VHCGTYVQSEITGGPAYMSVIHERQKDKKIKKEELKREK
jgi:hypothetical protein